MSNKHHIDPSTQYLADEIAKAIRDGFRDLGDRIAEETPDGTENVSRAIRDGFSDLGNRIGQGDALDGTENLSIPLMKAADGLMEVASALAHLHEQD